MIGYFAACIMLATRFVVLRVKKLKDEGLPEPGLVVNAALGRMSLVYVILLRVKRLKYEDLRDHHGASRR